MLAVSWLTRTRCRTDRCWFVESLSTQALVAFVIRTRPVPFFRSPSRPSLAEIGKSYLYRHGEASASSAKDFRHCPGIVDLTTRPG
jgi:hypothetical protein